MQVFTHDHVDALNALYPDQACKWEDYERAHGCVAIVQHPVAADAIRVLRDWRTLHAKFQRYAHILRDMLLIRALEKLPLDTCRTPTVHGTTTDPLITETEKLVSDNVDFAVILRAGEALLDRQLLPKSRIATYGIKRDETTLQPHLYERALPPHIENRRVIILDPMLATGGSVNFVVNDLQELGVESITVMCVFASVPGVLRLKQDHHTIRIVTAALDPILDTRGYIVPGCGDFGDRYNGTVSEETSADVQRLMHELQNREGSS